jgi:hypothetical protein
MIRAVIAAAFLALAGLVASAPLDDCSKLPSWTIKDVNITSRDTVGNDGRATFTFVNNLTQASDTVTCSLVANYRCEINGVPSEKSVKINIQSMMETLYVSVEQTQTCEGKPSWVSQ